ncbi:hypothetical protein TEQG_03860 [Trichophyton equinum CBS 127.97]|uniref:Uncharacterized protein n=1 Tax=Trichophyton equinum (strain ATCC MYA-4606 / CBS 127.97) TaxID=559882 RepID=F2PT00_TRIEC|nr:hypothetical protein TEQG_03860 [Trichophyton equinum CBS 127.97]
MAPKQQSDKGKQPAPVPLVRLCQAERLADYQMSLLRNISPSAIQQYIAQALEGTKKPTNGCGSIRLVQGSLQTTIASTRDSAGGWSDECPVESHIREVEECNYVDGASHHNCVWAFGRAVKHMAVLHVAAGDLTLLLE